MLRLLTHPSADMAAPPGFEIVNVVVLANLKVPTGGPEVVTPRFVMGIGGLTIPETHLNGWVEFVGRVLGGHHRRVLTRSWRRGWRRSS